MSEIHLRGSIGNWNFYQNQNPKTENKEIKETKSDLSQNEAKQANPNNVLDALNVIGKQNIAMISVNNQEIDPAKYLSDDRIASIENSMAEFEKGVSKYSEAIKKEFGNVLSDDAINELAANAFFAAEI